jgi:hypothetical protein
MVAFELRGVTGGWQTATVGPSDHVEFAVHDAAAPGESTSPDSNSEAGRGGPVAHTYASFHQLLRLYDCAVHERTTHPQFLGYDLTERGDALEIDLRTARVETTYPELEDALEAFLGDVFDALDAHPSHGTRDTHLDTLADHDVALVDVHDLYRDLASDEIDPGDADSGDADSGDADPD